MLTPRAPHRILFVCLSNICRSPAAEIIMRHQAREAGLADCFHIDSAGTIGLHGGSPPAPEMAQALRVRGYPVTGRSRKIVPDDLRNFDLIVTMDESNFADVRWLDSERRFHDKIRPFMSFCQRHSDRRVPDPYYGGQRGFDHVINLLEDGCDGILTELASPKAPNSVC